MAYTGTGTSTDPFICYSWADLIAVSKIDSGNNTLYVEMDNDTSNKIIDFNDVVNGIPFTSTVLNIDRFKELKWNNWTLRNMVLNNCMFMSRANSNLSSCSWMLSNLNIENLVYNGSGQCVLVGNSSSGNTKYECSFTNLSISVLLRSTQALSNVSTGGGLNICGMCSNVTLNKCRINIKYSGTSAVANYDGNHSSSMAGTYAPKWICNDSVIEYTFATHIAHAEPALAPREQHNQILLGATYNRCKVYITIGKYAKGYCSSGNLCSYSHSYVGSLGCNATQTVFYLAIYNHLQGLHNYINPSWISDINLLVDVTNTLSEENRNKLSSYSTFKVVTEEQLTDAEYLESIGWPIVT